MRILAYFFFISLIALTTSCSSTTENLAAEAHPEESPDSEFHFGPGPEAHFHFGPGPYVEWHGENAEAN